MALSRARFAVRFNLRPNRAAAKLLPNCHVAA